MVKKLYVLLCGFEILPKTVSTRDRGARFIISSPISAYLFETERGYVLFDTGYDPSNSRDPAEIARIFTSHGWIPPVINPEHELDRQLAGIGVALSDIQHVILSHLHFDHTGYLKHLTHARRISIQRQEYEAAFAGRAGPAVIESEYQIDGLNWDIVDGDWEVMPGLAMIGTRGHTAGHQSAVVDLANAGRMVLVADAGDLQENFDEEILPGESVDDEAALHSIRRLKALAVSGTLLLGHDPVAIQSIRLTPDFYD
jgi:N-acyl homoserine lactone hydrolase